QEILAHAVRREQRAPGSVNFVQLFEEAPHEAALKTTDLEGTEVERAVAYWRPVADGWQEAKVATGNEERRLVALKLVIRRLLWLLDLRRKSHHWVYEYRKLVRRLLLGGLERKSSVANAIWISDTLGKILDTTHYPHGVYSLQSLSKAQSLVQELKTRGKDHLVHVLLNVPRNRVSTDRGYGIESSDFLHGKYVHDESALDDEIKALSNIDKTDEEKIATRRFFLSLAYYITEPAVSGIDIHIREGEMADFSPFVEGVISFFLDAWRERLERASDRDRLVGWSEAQRERAKRAVFYLHAGEGFEGKGGHYNVARYLLAFIDALRKLTEESEPRSSPSCSDGTRKITEEDFKHLQFVIAHGNVIAYDPSGPTKILDIHGNEVDLVPKGDPKDPKDRVDKLIKILEDSGVHVVKNVNPIAAMAYGTNVISENVCNIALLKLNHGTFALGTDNVGTWAENSRVWEYIHADRCNEANDFAERVVHGVTAHVPAGQKNVELAPMPREHNNQPAQWFTWLLNHLAAQLQQRLQ
ncbi:MAG: hypothetical protein ACPGUV_00930, partial [Polyangiales bacterium]